MERTVLDTPLGPLAIETDTASLLAVRFDPGPTPAAPGPLARRAASVLAAYFAGDLEAPAGLPVALDGTAFRRRVWAALRAIPPGSTASYRDVAERIGAPRAVRAVGSANAANPVAVVVPCHRVVRADGTLGGYAAGTPRKRWLLDHEAVRAGVGGPVHGPSPDDTPAPPPWRR